MNQIPGYPLTWPAGQPRRPANRRERNWHFSRTRTIADARDELLAELGRLGASRIIISSNLRLRQDGLPIGNQAQPADPAVAVYFVLDGQNFVLSCDAWDRVEQNMWAIRLHVEALRGTERWGVGKANQAFTGYRALPTPRTDQAMTVEEAESFILEKAGAGTKYFKGTLLNDRIATERLYRSAAAQCHPDAGGDHETFVRLQDAKRVLDEHHGKRTS